MKKKVPSKRSGAPFAERSEAYEKMRAVVVEEFCSGRSADQIATRMRDLFGKKSFSREMPYRFLREAAQQGSLRYVPATDRLYEKTLAELYPFLVQSGVVKSSLSESVAKRAAEVVFELICFTAQKRASEKQVPIESVKVHVGMAGGKTMSLTAEEVGKLLDNDPEGLPGTIVWHSLMPGLDPSSPALSPTAFCSNLAPPRRMVRACQMEFVDFEAPPVVDFDLYDRLLEAPTIKEAVKLSSRIDIVVTSAGSFNDEHSCLKQHYKGFLRKFRNEKSSENLIRYLKKERGCVGDLLWLPLCTKKELIFRDLTDEEKKIFQFRPVSLWELSDLRIKIKNGVSVVLAIGHCQECLASKADVLYEILALSQKDSRGPLITHVVADVSTVSEVVRRTRKERQITV